MCADQGSNSISLYDSRQKGGERRKKKTRFMPPTVAGDINVGGANFPQEKSILGNSLPFVIYSNIKLFLPAKTNGDPRMQIPPQKKRGQRNKNSKYYLHFYYFFCAFLPSFSWFLVLQYFGIFLFFCLLNCRQTGLFHVSLWSCHLLFLSVCPELLFRNLFVFAPL